jgi:hypothetical protein
MRGEHVDARIETVSFSAAFGKATGMTPMRYRRNLD